MPLTVRTLAGAAMLGASLGLMQVGPAIADDPLPTPLVSFVPGTPGPAKATPKPRGPKQPRASRPPLPFGRPKPKPSRGVPRVLPSLDVPPEKPLPPAFSPPHLP